MSEVEETKGGTHKVPIAKWEEAQKTAFTHWINTMLARRKTKIDDLQTGFQDGVKLVVLAEVLVGKPIGQRYVDKPKLKAHKINNAFIALKFLQDVGGVRFLRFFPHQLRRRCTGNLTLYSALGADLSLLVLCPFSTSTLGLYYFSL
jgi:hypothetical protein